MKHASLNPQIDLAKIPVGHGIAGAVFAVGSLAILVIGVPEIQVLLPAAVVAGCGIALVLRWIR